jgi:hypothetical protein
MELPQLMGASVELGVAGFQVAQPVVERRLPAAPGHLVADRRRAILRIDAVGTFAIADGDSVRFDPLPGAAPEAVSMWLHGTVAALLLAQRGGFALHASVVEVHGVGVALAGRQRAGKSTTALRLTQRGHSLVTDDVSPLEGAGPVTVQPFSRPVYVFPHTAARLGLDVSSARPVLPEHPKLALPGSPRSAATLGGIVILRAEAEGPVGAAAVRGARAAWLVFENIYRVQVLRMLWEEQMFSWSGALAAAVPVHVVTRPAEGWTVDEVADAVEGVVAAAAQAGS